MNRIHSPFAWLIGLTAISFIVSGVATIGSHSGIGVLIILFTGFACVLVWAASLDSVSCSHRNVYKRQGFCSAPTKLAYSCATTDSTL